MSWSNTNAGLIKQLKGNGVIHSAIVENAMLSVDRGNFIYNNPYVDTPQLIGHGQTISAPHMHGYALEILKDVITKPNANILDVGVGSGYLAACIAKMNPTAKVYGIDVVPNLVEAAIKNVNKEDPELLRSKRLEIFVGDGWKGIPSVKFDGIHVGAAAPELPQSLLNQLSIGGILVIPVGREGDVQKLMELTKLNDDTNFNSAFKVRNLLSVQYVPLVKK